MRFLQWVRKHTTELLRVLLCKILLMFQWLISGRGSSREAPETNVFPSLISFDLSKTRGKTRDSLKLKMRLNVTARSGKEVTKEVECYSEVWKGGYQGSWMWEKNYKFGLEGFLAALSEACQQVVWYWESGVRQERTKMQSIRQIFYYLLLEGYYYY